MFLLAVAMLQPSFSNAQTMQWAKTLGSNLDDVGKSIAVDDEGNVYSIGTFRDTVDFDPGPGTFYLTAVGITDFFICKLDFNGDFVWAKAMGGTVFEDGNGITLDAEGNVYCIGTFLDTVDFDPGPDTYTLTTNGVHNIFIVKLSPNGDFVWAKAMGGAGRAISNSIAVDEAGYVYSTGAFWDTADFDPGPSTFSLISTGWYDIFVSKLDFNGDFVWAKAMVGNYKEFGSSGSSIAVDAAGNVYTTGKFELTVDFDPGPGTAFLHSIASVSIFISKLDANGDFVWAQAFIYGHGTSIAVDATGHVYTTGVFYGNPTDFDPGPGIVNLANAGENDIFVSKLDTDGHFIWAKGIGGTSWDQTNSIALDPEGNVYLTGYFRNTVDFDPGPGTTNLTSMGFEDIFLSKLTTEGEFVWARAMNGARGDLGNSIAVDAAGYIYSVGSFRETVDFDPGASTFNLTSQGGSDIFIHKMTNPSTSISSEWDDYPLSVYPNPSTGRFVLEGEAGSAGILRISVFNSLGQEVIPAREVQPAAQWSEEIDLSSQPDGVYFLRISDGSGSFSRQLAVRR